MRELDWYGCYSNGWQGEITPEAFAHPAKFSRILIRRIYEHALQQLDLPASEVAMVGDKVREDVKGPAKLGIRGVLKRGAVNRNKKAPRGTPEIDTISELPELIRNWKP